MKVGIVTLGCDKNTVDNEYLAGLLDRHGISVMRAEKEPGSDILDAVVINTCGFVESAKAESIRSILSWVEHKKERADSGERLRVFVAGCLTQRYKESLVSELPEVDGFVGVGEWEKIAQLVQSPAGAASRVNLIQELPSVEVREALPRKALGPQLPYAFLKIADGCNHNCTFCAIPSFKGRLRSVKKEILLAEVKLLLSRGVREINIVAQDTSDYGKDLYGRDYGIADLLSDVVAVPGDFWVRLFYFYPGGLTNRFLEVFASSPKIAKYIDMPLQHLHPDVLRRMKRPYKDVNTFESIERLRAVVRGVALRTTFIVGFPGETESEYKFLEEGIERVRFNRMGAFPFSIEEGTPSAELKPQLNKRLKKSRLDSLMKRQARISYDMNSLKVGTDCRVLVEGQLDDGRYVARSEADAPDVDGLVIVEGKDLRIGDFAHVRVTSADTYDLFATAV
jgi:ribosomal protein S12 methylthiotransferase